MASYGLRGERETDYRWSVVVYTNTELCNLTTAIRCHCGKGVDNEWFASLEEPKYQANDYMLQDGLPGYMFK